MECSLLEISRDLITFAIYQNTFFFRLFHTRFIKFNKLIISFEPSAEDNNNKFITFNEMCVQ